MLDWRSLQKLKGTYVDALPQLVNRETGRVHTSFNQAVAATGRLSSSDPNLQNIPIRTELGRQIRGAFVANEGALLISADYSQIELRVLAHLAGDESLVAAFERGDDIHDQTAIKVFGPAGLDPPSSGAARSSTTPPVRQDGVHARPDIGSASRGAGVIEPTSTVPRGAALHRRDHCRRPASPDLSTMFGRCGVPELTSRNGQIRPRQRVTSIWPIQGTPEFSSAP